MGLADQHEQIWGTDAEDALVWVRGAQATLGINQFRERYGEQRGQDAYYTLLHHGLISRRNSLAANASLTEQGVRLAEHIARSRLRGERRAEDVARFILDQLDDDERPPRLSDLLGDQPAVFDEPITADELYEAGTWLKEEGLIKANIKLSSSRHDMLRPEITRLGRRVLEAAADQSLHKALRSHTREGTTMNDNRSYSMTTTGPVGSVVQGDHATVEVTQQVLSPTQQQQAHQIVTDLLANPEVQNAPELVHSLHQLDEEISGDQPTKQGIMAKASETLLTATAQAAGTAAGPLVITALQQLPQFLG